MCVTRKLRFDNYVNGDVYATYASILSREQWIPIEIERKGNGLCVYHRKTKNKYNNNSTRAHLRVFHGGCYGDGGRVRQQEVVLVHQLVLHEHRGAVLVTARTVHHTDT